MQSQISIYDIPKSLQAPNLTQNEREGLLLHLASEVKKRSSYATQDGRLGVFFSLLVNQDYQAVKVMLDMAVENLKELFFQDPENPSRYATSDRNAAWYDQFGYSLYQCNLQEQLFDVVAKTGNTELIRVVNDFAERTAEILFQTYPDGTPLHEIQRQQRKPFNRDSRDLRFFKEVYGQKGETPSKSKKKEPSAEYTQRVEAWRAIKNDPNLQPIRIFKETPWFALHTKMNTDSLSSAEVISEIEKIRGLEEPDPETGYTLLHLAASLGNTEAIDALCAHFGPDILGKIDNHRNTPFEVAVQNGHFDVAIQLYRLSGYNPAVIQRVNEDAGVAALYPIMLAHKDTQGIVNLLTQKQFTCDLTIELLSCVRTLSVQDKTYIMERFLYNPVVAFSDLPLSKRALLHHILFSVTPAIVQTMTDSEKAIWLESMAQYIDYYSSFGNKEASNNAVKLLDSINLSSWTTGSIYFPKTWAPYIASWSPEKQERFVAFIDQTRLSKIKENIYSTTQTDWNEADLAKKKAIIRMSIMQLLSVVANPVASPSASGRGSPNLQETAQSGLAFLVSAILPDTAEASLYGQIRGFACAQDGRTLLEPGLWLNELIYSGASSELIRGFFSHYSVSWSMVLQSALSQNSGLVLAADPETLNLLVECLLKEVETNTSLNKAVVAEQLKQLIETDKISSENRENILSYLGHNKSDIAKQKKDLVSQVADAVFKTAQPGELAILAQYCFAGAIDQTVMSLLQSKKYMVVESYFLEQTQKALNNSRGISYRKILSTTYQHVLDKLRSSPSVEDAERDQLIRLMIFSHPTGLLGLMQDLAGHQNYEDFKRIFSSEIVRKLPDSIRQEAVHKIQAIALLPESQEALLELCDKPHFMREYGLGIFMTAISSANSALIAKVLSIRPTITELKSVAQVHQARVKESISDAMRQLALSANPEHAQAQVALCANDFFLAEHGSTLYLAALEAKNFSVLETLLEIQKSPGRLDFVKFKGPEKIKAHEAVESLAVDPNNQENLLALCGYPAFLNEYGADLLGLAIHTANMPLLKTLLDQRPDLLSIMPVQDLATHLITQSQQNPEQFEALLELLCSLHPEADGLREAYTLALLSANPESALTMLKKRANDGYTEEVLLWALSTPESFTILPALLESVEAQMLSDSVLIKMASFSEEFGARPLKRETSSERLESILTSTDEDGNDIADTRPKELEVFVSTFLCKQIEQLDRPISENLFLACIKVANNIAVNKIMNRPDYKLSMKMILSIIRAIGKDSSANIYCAVMVFAQYFKTQQLDDTTQKKYTKILELMMIHPSFAKSQSLRQEFVRRMQSTLDWPKYLEGGWNIACQVFAEHVDKKPSSRGNIASILLQKCIEMNPNRYVKIEKPFVFQGSLLMYLLSVEQAPEHPMLNTLLAHKDWQISLDDLQTLMTAGASFSTDAKVKAEKCLMALATQIGTIDHLSAQIQLMEWAQTHRRSDIEKVLFATWTQMFEKLQDGASISPEQAMRILQYAIHDANFVMMSTMIEHAWSAYGLAKQDANFNILNQLIQNALSPITLHEEDWSQIAERVFEKAGTRADLVPFLQGIYLRSSYKDLIHRLSFKRLEKTFDYQPELRAQLVTWMIEKNCFVLLHKILDKQYQSEELAQNLLSLMLQAHRQSITGSSLKNEWSDLIAAYIQKMPLSMPDLEALQQSILAYPEHTMYLRQAFNKALPESQRKILLWVMQNNISGFGVEYSQSSSADYGTVAEQKEFYKAAMTSNKDRQTRDQSLAAYLGDPRCLLTLESVGTEGIGYFYTLSDSLAVLLELLKNTAHDLAKPNTLYNQATITALIPLLANIASTHPSQIYEDMRAEASKIMSHLILNPQYGDALLVSMPARYENLRSLCISIPTLSRQTTKESIESTSMVSPSENMGAGVGILTLVLRSQNVQLFKVSLTGEYAATQANGPAQWLQTLESLRAELEGLRTKSVDHSTLSIDIMDYMLSHEERKAGLSNVTEHTINAKIQQVEKNIASAELSVQEQWVDLCHEQIGYLPYSEVTDRIYRQMSFERQEQVLQGYVKSKISVPTAWLYVYAMNLNFQYSSPIQLKLCVSENSLSSLSDGPEKQFAQMLLAPNVQPQVVVQAARALSSESTAQALDWINVPLAMCGSLQWYNKSKEGMPLLQKLCDEEAYDKVHELFQRFENVQARTSHDGKTDLDAIKSSIKTLSQQKWTYKTPQGSAVSVSALGYFMLQSLLAPALLDDDARLFNISNTIYAMQDQGLRLTRQDKKALKQYTKGRSPDDLRYLKSWMNYSPNAKNSIYQRYWKNQSVGMRVAIVVGSILSVVPAILFLPALLVSGWSNGGRLRVDPPSPPATVVDTRALSVSSDLTDEDGIFERDGELKKSGSQNSLKGSSIHTGTTHASESDSDYHENSVIRQRAYSDSETRRRVATPPTYPPQSGLMQNFATRKAEDEISPEQLRAKSMDAGGSSSRF